MTQLRISEAATLLGVSDDTVRRWGEAGRIALDRDDVGRLTVDGRELAELLRASSATPEPGRIVGRSARNRFTGIVTRVVRDGVMAQVEMQAGPFRVVSLMSREAADELALDAGVVAVASVKSTNVVIEIPEHR
jgi:molybdopterin-binding protein